MSTCDTWQKRGCSPLSGVLIFSTVMANGRVGMVDKEKRASKESPQGLLGEDGIRTLEVLLVDTVSTGHHCHPDMLYLWEQKLGFMIRDTLGLNKGEILELKCQTKLEPPKDGTFSGSIF